MGLFDLTGTANPNVYSSFFGGADLNTALQQQRPIDQQFYSGADVNSAINQSRPSTTQQTTTNSAPAPTNTYNGPALTPGGNQIDSFWGANTDAHLADLQRQQDELKNQISSGWDNYLNSLGGLQGGLNDQRTAQENIANSQYDTGVNTLNSQKAKSVRDISQNISNAFKAGGTYLGNMGAGNSSATDMLTYALGREGSKQTGNLNEYVSNQLQQLGSAKDQQINQIASWFADAQNQIKQQIASGQLNKSRDIQALSQGLLNQALQAKAQVEQNAQSQYNGLLSWAASNSQNLGQLQQNIAGIPQALGAPQIDSSGNNRIPFGSGSFGSTTDDRNRLFPQ